MKGIFWGGINYKVLVIQDLGLEILEWYKFLWRFEKYKKFL